MDKEFLYDLMAEFEKRDIHELSFENEQGSVHLLKAAVVTQQAVVDIPPAVVSVDPSAAREGVEIIKAPIVGNFYRQAAPDALCFVDEGQRVSKGQTLCILEAMKLMNELKAEFDCEIVKILLENGTMVEFGTPLFEVKRV